MAALVQMSVAATSVGPARTVKTWTCTRRPVVAAPARRVTRRGGGARAAPVVAEAAAAATGKLISKVDIPPFIPRSDLIDQLIRWASIEIQENGVANIGCPCKVSPYKVGDDTWGLTIAFLKDGESTADVRIAFDGETTLKHEWVGRGEDGFPVLEGNVEEIEGKALEIRKVCDRSISDNTRECIREFCTQLVAAINKYYAFGSCFADDST